MKLRTKLTLITVGIVVLSVALSTLFIITFAKKNMEDAVIAAGMKTFDTFYDSLSNTESYSDSELSDVSRHSYVRYRFLSISGNSEFALQQGDTIISNNTGINVVMALASRKVSVVNLQETGLPVNHTFYSMGGKDFLLMSASVTITQHEYTLLLARNITESTDNIATLGLKCIATELTIITIAALLVLLLVQRSLKPVDELEKGASEIAEGNYESRIILKGYDEIATVAEQFNRMAVAISDKITALHETSQRQQAFINGLSHEIKTPIASIMARAETLLGREITEDDRIRSLERIYHQCAWLERLSGKLTTLVMLQGEIKRKPESVAELFASVEETISESLEANRMELLVDCRMETLCMDIDLMHSALVNLIDNARKASARGAVIELRAHENIIEVKDIGKGIPKEEIARVAEPFYMVDRSRSKKDGGSGLGLALVKRIAEAHGAKMEIISILSKGTTIRLIFAPDAVDKKITFF
jgi:signal transduction histidine kinase